MKIPQTKITIPKSPSVKLPKVTVPKSPNTSYAAKGSGSAPRTTAATQFKAAKMPKPAKVAPPAAAVPPALKAKPTRLPWLGNKTGTPRTPGAAKQHRAQQVSDSAYPSVKF